jgi:hypothetical protein
MHNANGAMGQFLYLYTFGGLEMDPQTVTQIWLDLATNAPFLGFLLYQYWDQRKTNREQQQEMREIRLEARANEDAVRARFETVVQDLNKDRDQLIDGFSSRIDSLEKGQRKLFAILEPLKEEIHTMRLKEQIKEQITKDVIL